jgi:hypothetical protein
MDKTITHHYFNGQTFKFIPDFSCFLPGNAFIACGSRERTSQDT